MSESTEVATIGTEEIEPSMLSDATLLGRLQAGDEKSFEALYFRHFERVYGVLYRLVGDRAEAEDLAQNVFLKLFYAPERIRADGGQANLAGWLYRVAVNAGYNALRSRRRRQAWRAKIGQLWSVERPKPGPEQLIEVFETQQRVRQVLLSLKPRQAKLLVLRQAGLSYQELAVVLGVAPGSIGSLLTRAERAFREMYERMFAEEE